MSPRFRSYLAPRIGSPLALALAVVGGCAVPAALDEPEAEPTPFGDADDPSPPVQQPASPGSTLADRASRADAVVVGQVVSIAHRLSAVAGPVPRALPHTFVTFRVEQAAFGARPGDLLTLRFLGGPDGAGRVMVVSDAPWFRVGDTELLLVLSNDRAACPLVGCAEGRFRVVDGLVHDDEGRPVRADATRQIAKGARVPGVRVETLDVGATGLMRVSPEVEEPVGGAVDAVADAASDWLEGLRAAAPQLR